MKGFRGRAKKHEATVPSVLSLSFTLEHEYQPNISSALLEVIKH